MERTKWIDRKFNLGIPSGWLPNILTRLDGVTIRLKELTKKLTDAQLSYQPQKTWSIKEHIGHLVDLEDLHTGRVVDFMNKKEILRAADMSNKLTYDANHNDKTIAILIAAFESKRTVFINSLQSLDDETQAFVATHPRLKIPMRAVDMAFFTAEHDDHHITSIVEIIALFK